MRHLALLIAASLVVVTLPSRLMSQEEKAEKAAASSESEATKPAASQPKPEAPAPETGQDPAGQVPEKAEAPAGTQPAVDATKVKIQITKVKGLVQVRTGPDAKWQRAKKGQVFPATGTEIRTGPRSAVTFVIPPDQTVVLDRLGTIKVIQALAKEKKRRTDLGLKYGRTQYQVEEAGLEHETRIHAPSATLAVRGTEVEFYDQPPFVPEAVSFTGRVQFRAYRRQMLSFGGKRRAGVRGDRASAAAHEAVLGKVDPSDSRARTEEEEELVLTLPGLGGIDSGSFDFGTDVGVAQAIKGSLEFDLNWVGTADLDLFVISPLGEVVSFSPQPGKIVRADGLAQVPSGGMFQGDDNGADGDGFEKIIWPDTFPSGTFTAGAQFFSGSTPGSFQLDVIRTLPQQSPETIGSFGGTLDAQVPLSTNVINVGQ